MQMLQKLKEGFDGVKEGNEIKIEDINTNSEKELLWRIFQAKTHKKNNFYSVFKHFLSNVI